MVAWHICLSLKFIYSEKATKFCEISTLFLSECTVDKGKVEILQNFVVFLEYTNFITDLKKFSSLTLSDDSLNWYLQRNINILIFMRRLCVMCVHKISLQHSWHSYHNIYSKKLKKYGTLNIIRSSKLFPMKCLKK